MTLKDTMASDVNSVFLNTDEFAETVEVEVDGVKRSVSAVIEEKEDEIELVRGGTHSNKETLTVWFDKSATLGIARPREVAKLIRNSERDYPYVWTQEVVDDDEYMLTLRFQRLRVRQVGGDERLPEKT